MHLYEPCATILGMIVRMIVGDVFVFREDPAIGLGDRSRPRAFAKEQIFRGFNRGHLPDPSVNTRSRPTSLCRHLF